MRKEAESRAKHFVSTKEELGKFEEEFDKFDFWLNTAESQLRATQRSTGELKMLAGQKDEHKVCSFLRIAALALWSFVCLNISVA